MNQNGFARVKQQMFLLLFCEVVVSSHFLHPDLLTSTIGKHSLMHTNSLTGLSLASVSASECEFLAKETLIEISPKFSHPKLKFISVCELALSPSLLLWYP